ncbi:MAG TPA: D-aminoacyl-tRNA deacylase [Bacilli bacterium]
MRIVLQRCKQAAVTVEGHIVGQIQQGMLLLVGVTHDDTVEDTIFLADKLKALRIFHDGQGKMNLSLAEMGGQILSVSQFTLYGDCSKGRRPNFMSAARPEHALFIFETFNTNLRNHGFEVETGAFGEMMEVALTNSGPVTFFLDSKHRNE